MPDPAAPAEPLPAVAAGRRAPAASRRWLDAGWEICQAPAGSTEPPGPEARWRAIGEAQPVAAALAALGDWSLDGPARDFDAETWWYRLHFDAPAASGAVPRWVLGLDGLATLAEVVLNGRSLLHSRSMFRRHELALDALQAEGNLLMIRFDPLAAALAVRRPRPRWRVPMLAQQQLRWWRTTVLGRTPGWSPPAAVVGPWQPVWLEDRAATALAECRLATAIDPRGGDECGRLRLCLRFTGAQPLACDAVLRRGDQEARCSLQLTEGVWTGEVEVFPLARWWPHTHGEPACYELTVHTQADNGARRWPLGTVGFRDLALDTEGGGFALRVNGEPVFCRGACWVPLDTLRLHAHPAALAEVIGRVRAAGMNMLRVPGTMVYESPAFFEACNAAGILVWQDLMFANMDYPAGDPAFDAEVAAELAQQLLSWQAHPCLAVVCGNSEVSQQAAMWGAEHTDWAPPLFHQTVPAAVAEHLAGVPYWPSSAWGGDFPFQSAAGTTSYYGVGAYRRPVEDARHSALRFATECLAFANLPGDDTLARVPGLGVALQAHHPGWKARAPRDLGAGWDFDDVREHYAEQWSGQRGEALRASDPARHRALARAVSGQVMAEAFDHWRRADSVCGGAVVWTLRDLWAGAGWGLLDDRGQPKPAWHGLARALQPLHLAVIDEGLDGLAVHLANEAPVAAQGELELVLHQHGETEVARWRGPLRLAPRSRCRHGLVALLGRFIDAGWAYRFGPRPVSLAVARWWPADTMAGVISRHWLAPGSLRLGGPDIGLTARAEPGAADPATRRVRVSTRAAALGVHFEADGWRAGDEFFHLAPGEERVVAFEPATPGAGASAPPPWRVMVGALNTDRWSAVTQRPPE